ncbi:MAG: glycosyltransferase [Gracilimonas sp.]|uniref:glycosyltransferase n=1 Tax=Gracilimonas TaxID=649462 RepID=UPI001B0C69DD|nr:glycosyltransferase [Gracilimonas sp.]MBO6587421.1 glycosyltransferase [Gracilimonas sp.]MBO6614093.1 glycosyltransferase [Gracilimonas sp.]
MQNAAPHISVVIVNYKVKEYIANLLNSLKKAQHDFALEIFVVDNDSGDDSVSYLKERYPEVNYIANEENVGFGKANNQAIRQAKGEFTLIINPDTLVSEDTLDVLVNHMNENPECGAAGCKILNPDGTFAPESRRSIPTIWSASCKVFGLNTLFPESKLFSQYYLSWMGEDEASEIPVLSGSFMFWRTDLLKELDGFDERFFMYGEDIDLCYRVQKTDFRIDYVPDTSIIHYKGESTKKGDLRYIRIFNKALYQFFDKHYSARYSLFFRIFIYLAIWLKTALSFISTNLKKLKPVFADLILLNLSVALGFLIRYGIKGTNILTPEGTKYLWINLLMTLLFLFSGSLLGMFKKNKESISTALKALSITYSGVVIITFFVRNLAYSRLGLIFGFILGVIFFVTFKLIRANRKDAGNMNRGRLRNSRVILVGDAGQSADIISKIHTRPDWSYEVVGYVNVDEDDEKALGGLTQLRDLVKAYQVDQVFFALNSISYKQMLKEISNLQKEEIVFKLIPDSMDFILGKSNVEYLEVIPLVEVEFEYSKPINRLLKRLLDLGLSVPLFVLLLLVCWPAVLFSRRDWVFVDGIKLYRQIEQNKWKNRLRLLWYVISGKLSLVGAPISESVMEQSSTAKKGVTGLIQISKNRIQQEEEAESFGLYYLQNYSLWMDIDILIKTIFNGPHPLEILSETEKKD